MAMKTMIDLQLAPISILLDKAGQNGSKLVRNSISDPVLYLDRLAAIFRHVTIELEPGQPHPAAGLATQEVWPVLSRNFSVYTADSRIMERTCRTLRFLIRCVGTQSAPLVEPLVKMLVSLYIVHPHSCFLYLVSFMNYSTAIFTKCPIY
jgi:transportin-3